MSGNPLFEKSTFLYQAPNFPAIKEEHYIPAFVEGMKKHIEEVQQIATNSEEATFKNTIYALELSGADFSRAWEIFQNLYNTDSTDGLIAIQDEYSPIVSSHFDSIYLNGQLFTRVKKVYEESINATIEHTPEENRLIEVTYERFVRAGANLTEEQKTRVRELNEAHSKLTTRFGTNLMKELENISIVIDSVEQLDGLSEGEIANAKDLAVKRGYGDNKWVLKLTNTARHPQYESIKNRAVRERIWKASVFRNQSGANSNLEIVAQLALIRAEKAALLGYSSWSAYAVADQMAKTPQAVRDMLVSMLPAVKRNVAKELHDIKEFAAGDASLGVPAAEVKPWDWEFIGGHVRSARYNLDEEKVKEYMELDRVVHDGVFKTMNRLFGVTFEPRPDIPVYHPDVKAWEVFIEENGQKVSKAVFYTDYWARKGKRGGAWMSNFVGQSQVLNQRPVVVNVLNVPKPADASRPTLLTFDEATTIFHELGHGLHGMLSNVLFPSLAGTNVATDFVEFPSTVHEDWSHHPEVVKGYAFHHKTNEAIDRETLEKIVASRTFNQGYDTLEYLSAALLDVEWHSLEFVKEGDEPKTDGQKKFIQIKQAIATTAKSVEGENTTEPKTPNFAYGVEQFEREVLKSYDIEVIELSAAEDAGFVPPRYRSQFFNHSMGGGYSSSYYAYMWSEVLAADSFAYFTEGAEGGPDNRKVGDAYRQNILEVGNARDLMTSYKAFRGREPTSEALLIRRGLKTEVETA